MTTLGGVGWAVGPGGIAMLPNRLVELDRSSAWALALISVFALAGPAAGDPSADFDDVSDVVVLRGASVGGPIPPPRPAPKQEPDPVDRGSRGAGPEAAANE